MATTVPIILPIKTPGLADLQKLEKYMEAVERDAAKLTNTLPRASNAIQNTGRAAKKSANNFNQLAKGALAAGAAVAGFQIGKQILQVGVDAIESERRLKALSGAFGEVQATQLAAGRAAAKFGLSQREANQAFAQIYARLRPIGIELTQIETAFNGFNTAARLSGTSAQEASSAWLQLSQALGSGVLRGEELNSVFEQTPTVVQAIAKEMNAPIGQIRQLAKDGEITSDVVLRALGRLEREGVDQLAEAMNGPRQKFKDFSNATEKLSNALATTVLPDLTDSIAAVGETILLLEGPIKYISGLLSNALKQINLLISEITQAPAAAAKVNLLGGGNGLNLKNAFTFGDPKEGLKQLFGEQGFKELEAQAKEYAKLRNQSVQEVFKTLAVDRINAMEGNSYIKSGILKSPEFKLKPDGTKTKGGKSGASAASKAAKDAERLAQQTAERLLSAEKLVTAAQREGELLRANSDAEKAQIESMNAMMEIAEKYGELATQSLSEEETKLLLQSQGLEIENERYALEEKLADIRKSAMGGIEEEIAHMEAILAGTEKEYLLRKKIAELGGGPEAEAKVQRLEQLKLEVAAFEKMEAQVDALANTIAGSMTDAFTSIIDGSKSAEEALAGMMKNIAQSFIQMAADIIKEQIAMIIKGTIMKALGISMPGASGGGSDPFGTGLSSVAQIGGGMKSPFGRASGGAVSGNQPYMVGETGPELFIPQGAGRVANNNDSQMAMERYTRQDSSPMQPSQPIKIEYSSTSYGGQEYVTTAQFQQGIAAAAKEGAKAGETRVMASLRNSRSRRKAVGI